MSGWACEGAPQVLAAMAARLRAGRTGVGGPTAPALHGLRRRGGEVERDEVVERAQAERLDKVAVRASLDRAALVRVEALP
jgi:hypothetical protein